MDIKQIAFTKDEIITFTSGEYSDYRIDGIYIATSDFCMNEMLVAWAKATDRKYNTRNGSVFVDLLEVKDQMDFIPWLKTMNLVKRIEAREINIDYRDCSSRSVYEMDWEKDPWL